VSRHARRGTQGGQDWGPGGYPEDSEDPLGPDDYPSQPGWGPEPVRRADPGAFPAPGESYPRLPDPGRRHDDAYGWPPDPLPADPRHRDPLTGPQAPDRWAPPPGPERPWPPQPWAEPPSSWTSPPGPARSWEPQPRDAEPPPWEDAEPPPWQAEPGAPQSWGAPQQHGRTREARAEPADAYHTAPGGHPGALPPLPPGALPGSEHPSGPLSPLPPQQDFDWHQPDTGTLPPLPGPGSGFGPVPPGPVPPGPGSSRQLGAGPAGYLADHTGPAGYPAEPAGFEAEPPRERGRRRRAAGPPGGAGQPDPGYEQYVSDPRELDNNPHQDSGEYPATGGWYGDDEDESPAWTEEGQPSGFLPGLDQDGGGSQASQPPAGTSARKKRRRRGRVAILASLMIFVLILAAGGAVGYHYYRQYIDPPDFSGPGTGSAMVQIKPGDTAAAVGQRLASLGVVASARAFFNAAKASPRGSALEPGTYRVHKHMKASLALALLLQPSSRVQVTVAIPEGFKLSQIIARLGQATGNLKGYQQAITHPASLGLPAYAHGNPEGYLFPATYDIQPKMSPVNVLRMMVQKFRDEAVSINLKGAAAHGHEGEGAVITVASLIEAEGKLPGDYPRIAEVIYNRLNHVPPIKLQLDTTVLYAMDRAGKGNARFSTTFPSPYNTYLHANLPPGPINSPGAAAINAALHPDHGNFRFFLTINSASGKTLFFSTLAGFNAAVNKYGSTGTGTGTHTGSG
jgi:peptidoglycan lytic transglycosylase G